MLFEAYRAFCFYHYGVIILGDYSNQGLSRERHVCPLKLIILKNYLFFPAHAMC